MLLPVGYTPSTGISEVVQPKKLLRVYFIFGGNCLETTDATRSKQDRRGELGRSVASVPTLAGASYSLLV